MRWRTDIRTAFESLDRFRAGAQGIRTFELPSRLLIAFALCAASLHERLSDLQRHCNRNGYNDQREEQRRSRIDLAQRRVFCRILSADL